MPKGFFVTVEGIDGTGKTTQLNLLKERLAATGTPIITAKEPGDTVNGKYVGSEIGASIRHMLFTDPTTKAIDRDVTDLLFLADHIQLWRKTIVPALRAGKTVLCDRYADSQFAYGIAKKSSAWVQRLYKEHYGPVPDATVLLVGDPEFLLYRTKRAGTGEEGKQDGKVWASIEAQRLTRDAYLTQLAPYPRTITVHVTEGKGIEAVAEEIWGRLNPMYQTFVNRTTDDPQFEMFADGVKEVTQEV